MCGETETSLLRIKFANSLCEVSLDAAIVLMRYLTPRDLPVTFGSPLISECCC